MTNISIVYRPAALLYVQEPGLLVEAEGETAVTCLVMAQQEAQSLMVNRLVAAVAGHLVTELVLRRQATQLGAYFSLEPLTASNLASCGATHLEGQSP